MASYWSKEAYLILQDAAEKKEEAESVYRQSGGHCASAVVTDSVPRQNDENPVPSADTESVTTDSVQRQNDGRVASLPEPLDEFGKRLDMSLARRSENKEMIKEIEKILEEKCAIDSADVTATKKGTVGAGLSGFWGAGGARSGGPR